jgi:hypothetical protein
MSDKDQELEALLHPLKNIQPTAQQLNQWKNSVRAKKKIRRFSFLNISPIYQLTGALILGVAIGSFFVSARTSVQTSLCSSPKVCKCPA